MALTVENGDGLPNADSYVTTEQVAQYALRMGKVFAPDSEAQGEATCRIATAWIDGKYRSRFPGYKRRGRAQRREWPRIAAQIQDTGISGMGWYIMPVDEIPDEIVEATCEAAIRELAAPGSLMPDQTAGDVIQSVTAGSASVTFAGGGLNATMVSFPAIDMILNTLFPPINPYVGRSGRG